ncbi:hypothetical protein D3OALGA1CA_1673 [Olavius algarvensis associated proteobacterium Delta 3]|nr:hypothetical protein D3OALGA1CA_1673 [Olavius algarvensis associated proteobacterium Delta 3]
MIARGIAREKVFFDNKDHEQFLERLGVILKGSMESGFHLIPQRIYKCEERAIN